MSSDSRAQSLRFADLRFTRRPVTRAPAHAGHDEIHIDAELPLPEDSTPGDAAVGRRKHQLRRHAVLSVEPTHSMWASDTHTLVRQCASRKAGSLTFPVAPSLSPPQARNQPSTEDPSSRSAPTLRGSEPETPSTDGSTKRPSAYSADFYPEAATASPVSPPGRSFQLAFTHTRCALGLGANGYSPLAPRPRGAHRLLQSKRSVSTPEGGPNSDTYAEASFCWSESAARESSTHRAFTGQGPRALRSRYWHPPRRPLA